MPTFLSCFVAATLGFLATIVLLEDSCKEMSVFALALMTVPVPIAWLGTLVINGSGSSNERGPI